MKRLSLLAGIIVLLLVAALPASAKGPMPVLISGPGLPSGGVDIQDLDEAAPLSMGMLEDFVRGEIEPPSWAVLSYRLQRYGIDSAGQRRIFDQVDYYPNPTGGLGVVHYIGIYHGRSEYDGKWYAAKPEGDAAMRSLLVYQQLLAHLMGASYHVD
jgi:hypothetical protein